MKKYRFIFFNDGESGVLRAHDHPFFVRIISRAADLFVVYFDAPKLELALSGFVGITRKLLRRHLDG
jgi:hypothetical protein